MRSSGPRPFSRKTGGILAGLLLTGCVFLFLVMAAGVFVARNVHVRSAERNDGSDVSIDTPAGHLSVRAHENSGWTASDVPVYPGARRANDGGGGNAVVEWTSSNGKHDKEFSVSASEMVTPDSVDKVVRYYRDQLPTWIIATENDGAVRLELHEGGYKRIVAIHERHDGTHIGVASVGEPASN